MAGVWVPVCLPAEAAEGVEEALAAALAPFDMNSDTPVDDGRWDSWRIQGGSDGHGFAVAEGHFDDPRLIHDMPWWVEPNGSAVHGTCDPDRCAHTAPAVGARTELYLASLPYETLLVRLRCHC